MAKFSYEELEKKYEGFTAPTAVVELAGKKLSGYQVLSVQCETGVRDEAGVCTIQLGSVYDMQGSRFLCENDLVRGTPVTIGLGYIVTQTVFQGFLYEITYELGFDGEPGVELVCMDVKAAMMGVGILDFSGNRTYKQVIEGFFSGKNARGYRALCKAPSISLAELDQTVGRIPNQMDDFEFITMTAGRFGLECFVSAGKLLLRERPASPAVLMDLTPATGIGVRVRLRCAGYVREVTVLGGSDDERDSGKKQAKATAKNSLRIAPDNSDAGRLIGARRLELFSASVRTDKTAELLAKGQLRGRRMLGSELEMESIGLPELAPGFAVRLSKVSPKLNGDWYILSVLHTMDEDGFRTKIRAGRDL